MYIGAKAVEPLPGFKLLITFENGEQRVFNVKPYMERGIFRELKDTALFNSARMSFDTVEWANGADLCPETLYAESVAAGPERAAARDR
ncbi:MAG: DUF2442 domain-containing protein [Candidatus Hydrogenedentes bacterium]|nr:DUF2442 domain-containing protein [Candidatus Hydrogenedentota bacterium]